jgi:antitoxin HicB
MSSMNKQTKAKNPHIGSSFDDFLKEEGIFEELQAQAVKEVSAWQLKKVKKRKRTPQKDRA